MKDYNIDRLEKMLGLKGNIVGVKFIPYKAEYEALDDVPQLTKRVTYCNMVKRARDGAVFKAKKDNFFCVYSAFALGIEEPGTSVTSGRNFLASKLYETNAVSRRAYESMDYLHQDIYGVVVGALKELKDADVVIIVCTAQQVMRIMQGYAYKYGMPRSLRSFGNQAMCSDLTSKPFFSNDINVSFMCKGARMYMQCDDGELGIGLPVGLFDSIAEGVLMTLNPVCTPGQKRAILERLSDTPEAELGISIDMEADYGRYLDEYEKYVLEMEHEK